MDLPPFLESLEVQRVHSEGCFLVSVGPLQSRGPRLFV